MKKKISNFLLLSLLSFAIFVPRAGAFSDEDYIKYQMELNKALFIYGGDNAKVEEVNKKFNVESKEFQDYYSALLSDSDRFLNLQKEVEKKLPEERLKWLDEVHPEQGKESKPVEGQ